MQELILASGSRYRAELLGRLQLCFTSIASDVIENVIEGEEPASRADRLARAKARAVRSDHPAAVVIGADQVASVGKYLLHKPGSTDAARRQLSSMRGELVRFNTSLCVIDGRNGNEHHAMDVTLVTLRPLSDHDIDRYLEREDVVDCAGSFRMEGLGITLFDRIESTDPTGLTGMPLIALSSILRSIGFSLP